MTTCCALPAVSAAGYVPDALHAETRIWLEKNCYVDIWISVLQAAGLEPQACLGHVVSVDFDGDQWTFFKPSHDDLYEFYGIEVQELTVWRPLLEHAAEHLQAGRLISTESAARWSGARLPENLPETDPHPTPGTATAGPEARCLQGFSMVAGAGFEPATFGL